MRKDEFPLIDTYTNKKINEVLDKIKTEIKSLDDADYDYEGYYKAVTDALNIIDKYKQKVRNKYDTRKSR